MCGATDLECKQSKQTQNRWLFNDCLKNTEGTHCSDSRRHREKFDNSSLISHVPILTFRHRYQSVPATTILLCTHVLCLSSFTRVVSSKLKNGSQVMVGYWMHIMGIFLVEHTVSIQMKSLSSYGPWEIYSLFVDGY